MSHIKVMQDYTDIFCEKCKQFFRVTKVSGNTKQEYSCDYCKSPVTDTATLQFLERNQGI